MNVLAKTTNYGVSIIYDTTVVAKGFSEVDGSCLIDNRDFRDAIELSGLELTINSDKAIGIAQDKIRRWREAEFAKNDVSIQNALIDGDSEAQSAAVARRDYLRDLPAQCEGKTLDELKAILGGLE